MIKRENSIKKDPATKEIGLKNSIVKLAPDFFPDCWQDDERMENFFAPFRLKSVNPVNYDTKLKFWKNLIKEFCEVKGSAAVSVSELRDALQRNGKKPHCLSTVIEELLTDGSIKWKTEFMEPPQLTWSGWALDKLIKTPLKWSFNMVKARALPVAPDAKQLEATEFIVLEVAKSQGEKLLAFFNSQNDCLSIISTDDLYKQLAESDDTYSLDGAQLALHHLYCQQRASLQKATVDKKELILCKFSIDMNRNVEPITPLDISIYTLNKMEKSLTKSVDGIENDINKTDSQVRQYIREKKKQLAKSFLRKKHALEKNLAKTSNALTTVQSLLLQIDETKHNASIVEALKMGTSTLKNALDDRNITVDNVEDALADVKEILDANAEIQFALSGAQFNDILNDGIDDESLEAELNDLLDDDKVETVAAAAGGSNGGATGGIGLPTVPSDIKQPVVARTQKPSTMTNVIDDLLEERLKKLEMGNTINVNIGANANKPVLAQGVHQ